MSMTLDVMIANKNGREPIQVLSVERDRLVNFLFQVGDVIFKVACQGISRPSRYFKSNA
jgi:hypothetical protein